MRCRRRSLFWSALFSLALSLMLAGCAKSPNEMNFKQIQLQWNALDKSADSVSFKDSCEILITSRLMSDRRVLASELPEIQYDVFYGLDSSGALFYKGVCGGGVSRDLPECSWELTCGASPGFVVKFHNEQ